jgi:hypothetical protein
MKFSTHTKAKALWGILFLSILTFTGLQAIKSCLQCRIREGKEFIAKSMIPVQPIYDPAKWDDDEYRGG